MEQNTKEQLLDRQRDLTELGVLLAVLGAMLTGKGLPPRRSELIALLIKHLPRITAELHNVKSFLKNHETSL